MANVLIATLGESPIVVTSMVHALKNQKNLTIDELHVIYPRGDKLIDFGYDLLKEHLNGTCTVSESTLPFPDVNSHEASIEFLRILSESIQTHEDVGDHVYLSLAGGRKNMSALMAATCQFFECVRGLYHILDKNENDPTQQNFYPIEALFDFEENQRSEKLNPPADQLILVEIPYQQSSNGVALWQYFSEIASNPDAKPPIEINEELEDLGLEIRQPGEHDVYLSKEAHKFYQDAVKKGTTTKGTAKNLKNCFRSMRNPKNLQTHNHSLSSSKTDCICFKMGDTDERLFYYKINSGIVIATIMLHGNRYEKIANGNESLCSQDHPPHIHLNKLKEKRGKEKSVLIAPLGKTPMVVTQTFALLSMIEGADIEKVIVIHPKDHDIRKGVRLLKNVFGKKGKDRPIESIEVKGITDIASRDDCEAYLEKLTSVITKAKSALNKSIYLSLSGGRKGMAALTLFAAQRANIDVVYHTLIMDVDLEKQIERDTTSTALQRLGSRNQRVKRLFLEDYDSSKFELIRVPVIPI